MARPPQKELASVVATAIQSETRLRGPPKGGRGAAAADPDEKFVSRAEVAAKLGRPPAMLTWNRFELTLEGK